VRFVHCSRVITHTLSMPISDGAFGVRGFSSARVKPSFSGTRLLGMLALSWWISARSMPSM
jgi:hypothetical protein